MKSKASADEFVIQLPDGDRAGVVLDRLGALGTVEPLPGRPGFVVLRLADGPKPLSPKRTWSRLRKQLGDGAGVYPTLREDGASKFPVGTIMVRFKEPPSAAAVQRLADEHGLRLEMRNQFAPAQVAFVQNDAGDAYLPDLIDTIRTQGDLEAVWPVTLSAFNRGV